MVAGGAEADGEDVEQRLEGWSLICSMLIQNKCDLYGCVCKSACLLLGGRIQSISRAGAPGVEELPAPVWLRQEVPTGCICPAQFCCEIIPNINV